MSYPQMWKIYKTKSVADISISSILIKIIACSLYTIHGFVIWDLPLFVMTSIILLQYVIIFFQYKYYKKNKKCDATHCGVRSTYYSSNEHRNRRNCLASESGYHTFESRFSFIKSLVYKLLCASNRTRNAACVGLDEYGEGNNDFCSLTFPRWEFKHYAIAVDIFDHNTDTVLEAILATMNRGDEVTLINFW